MITVDLRELQGWAQVMSRSPQRLHKELMHSTNVVLMELVTDAKGRVPVKDGLLKNDIRVMRSGAYSGNAYTGMIGTDLIYSAQREYGGVIRARNKKFLRFEIDGRVIFTKQVTQTGSKYMENTQKHAELWVSTVYQLAVDRALEEIGG